VHQQYALWDQQYLQNGRQQTAPQAQAELQVQLCLAGLPMQLTTGQSHSQEGTLQCPDPVGIHNAQQGIAPKGFTLEQCACISQHCKMPAQAATYRPAITRASTCDTEKPLSSSVTFTCASWGCNTWVGYMLQQQATGLTPWCTWYNQVPTKNQYPPLSQ